ncbi:MAG TPA: glycosyltransferase family 2 protein [Anaerolineae bacterium]|nr:glycosyltransferase family 2 protein [Anaerolineae bacterium]
MTPKVSIIVPCFNEKHTIGYLLQAIHDQTFPRTDLEVIIADGMSTDGTRDVIQGFISDHDDLSIRLIDNPERIIPVALNEAIEAASGEVLIRLDAHSIPNRDYIERCLTVLESTGSANVGGLWEIRSSGEGWLARSIAIAAGHRLGAGDARYRTGGEAGEVDTVPFGAFKREWVDRVGPFDITLITNEDYEFNVRLRQAGGVIWFDSTIRSTYFARRDLISLARQYARYGYWKARMLRRYPESLRWRQALPPLFVLSVIVLGIAAFVWFPARLLIAVQLALYALLVFLVGIGQSLHERDWKILVGFLLAIWSMHFAWGGGFLWSIFGMIFGVHREPKRA